MKIAPPTDDEIERLKALYDYDVLDTEAESAFDELTQLASDICDTPISLISLVDPNRQWFKSTVGLDAKETSRDIAFCAHAIHEDTVFEIQNTIEDSRFYDNPLVTNAPNIRFYAGTQLRTPSGHAIGTLCVIDSKPHKLTEKQKKDLEVLGRAVISQLELRKHIRHLTLANQHKTDFLSNMSHELRTPLNAIIGFSRLMLEGKDAQQLSSKFTDYINHINYSGNRLLSVINSIIDINKIEAGKMQLKASPTRVTDFLDSLHSMLNVQAVEKGVRMHFDVVQGMPKLLQLDQAKVSQVIINLVHNAIKFTASGKSVVARFAWQNNQFKFTVADQGIGISAQDQRKLFTKFQQVGDNKKAEGSGLGLAICKSIVTFLKGEISLQSTPGKGSVFTVILPALSVSEQSQVTGETAIEQSFNKNCRILLVEDNEINQTVMQAMFESIGLTCSLASTGEEAVQQVQSQPFDIVFMDIHLPGINGKEAAHLIQAKLPDLPIVALSADAFSQPANPEEQNLWAEYLCKPLEKDLLVSALNRFVPSVEHE